MRVTLKPASACSAPQATNSKSSGASFLDLLNQLSGETAQAGNSAGSNAEPQSNDSSDQGDSGDAESLQHASPQSTADDAQQTSSDSGAKTHAAQGNPDRRNDQLTSAVVVGRLVKSKGGFKFTTASTTQPQRASLRPERSATPRAAQTAAQTAGSKASDSVQCAVDPAALQQPITILPSFTFPEPIGNQPATQSTVSSHDLPVAPAATDPDSSSVTKQQAAPQTDIPSTFQAAVSQRPLIQMQILQSTAAVADSKIEPAPAAKSAEDGPETSNAVARDFQPFATVPASSTFAQGSPLLSPAADSQPAAKVIKYQTAGATFTADSSGSKAVGDANAPASSAPKALGAASHTDSAGTQSTPHAQADPAQTIGAAAKPAETGTAQPIVFPAHADSNQPSQLHATPRSTDAIPLRNAVVADSPSEQLEGSAAAGTSAINTARVIQSMSGTEMRLGMHSSEFGDIAIRTSVSQQQVLAQISVDHGELGSTIAAHVPALQARLGDDFGLHTAIDVNQAASSFSNGHGQPSQHANHLPSNSASPESSAQAAEADLLTLSAAAPAADDARLDIRA